MGGKTYPRAELSVLAHAIVIFPQEGHAGMHSIYKEFLVFGPLPVFCAFSYWCLVHLPVCGSSCMAVPILGQGHMAPGAAGTSSESLQCLDPACV